MCQSSGQRFDAGGGDPVQIETDGFAVVDAGFTQTVARQCDISFDVTNLFDQLYEQGYGLPREGRTMILTLRARIR